MVAFPPHKNIYSLFTFSFSLIFKMRMAASWHNPLSLTITYLTHLSLSNQSISHSPLILWYLFGLTQLLRKKKEMETKELDEAMLQGQAKISQYMYGFADSMVLESDVELRIVDIIYSNSGAITLSQITSIINGGSLPDITCLARIIRLLIHRKV